MSNENVSWVQNEHGEIIGKDTTEHHADGSSTTTHQTASGGDLLHGPSATDITGVTHNSSDGTSTHTSR